LQNEGFYDFHFLPDVFWVTKLGRWDG